MCLHAQSPSPLTPLGQRTVESVRTRWAPEVRENGLSEARLVLVGITGTIPVGDSHAGAGTCPEEDSTSNDNVTSPVAHGEGAAVAHEVGASRFLVCNIQDVSSVSAVVHEAVRVARRARCRSGCVLQ